MSWVKEYLTLRNISLAILGVAFYTFMFTHVSFSVGWNV